MTNKDACAYPTPYSAEHHTAGLTKRELIAAMAMQGYAASGKGWAVDNTAETAVRMADALLEALK